MALESAMASLRLEPDAEMCDWNSLSGEIRCHVLQFLSTKERAVAATSSKRTRKECMDAILAYPMIQNAILPETLGRAFDQLICIGRYAPVELGVAPTLSKKARSLLHSVNDFKKLWDHNLTGDIVGLNRDMHTYWDFDYSGKGGSGCLGYIRAIVESNPEMNLAPHLLHVQHWNCRVQGTMYVLLQRPDGTVVVSGDLTQVFLVQGITQSLAKVVGQGEYPLPAEGVCTFLPFHGYVVFDGLLLGRPQAVGAALRRQLYRAYAAALDNHTLLTSLPTHTHAPEAPLEAPRLSWEQRAQQTRLGAMAKLSMPGGCWTFRRVGYTAEENPTFLLVVLTGSGRVLGPPLRTAALHPTALELFDLLVGLVGESGTCPCLISTDEISAVQGLRAVLPKGVDAAYYPPPSKEEEATGLQGADDNCACCGIPGTVLKSQSRPPLLRCGRCKGVVYCSRDCQRAHWRKHKQVCAP